MDDCEVRIYLKGLEPFNVLCTYEEALEFFANLGKEKFILLGLVMVNTAEIVTTAMVKINGVQDPVDRLRKKVGDFLKDKK